MNTSLRRYTDSMLIALSQQSIPALLINALVRGVIFTIILELIAFASGLVMSNIVQMLILVLVFGLLVFSVDLIEKYWTQTRLNRRG